MEREITCLSVRLVLRIKAELLNERGSEQVGTPIGLNLSLMQSGLSHA